MIGENLLKFHWTWGILLFATCSSIMAVGNESPEAQCVTLQPSNSTSTFSNSRNTTQIDLLTLLNDGSSQLDLSATQGILILGNTGSGKTTLTQIIAGNLSTLHAVLTQSGKLVIIDTNDRIGGPSTISKTLIPELIIQPGNNTNAIYDCPGFDDTRGAKMDIAANYFLNQVVKNLQKIKLIFTIIFSSVSLGNERLDFDMLVGHAAIFLKDIQKYRNGIGLVVTKVRNFSHFGTYISDTTIMTGIVEFLQKYIETLQMHLATESDPEKGTHIRNKITLVTTFLTRNNGNYNRISFSRDPEKCGSLSESTTVAGTKEKVNALIERLTYKFVNAADFGFSLKDKTSLYIVEALDDINKSIVQSIDSTTINFKTWFENSKLNTSDISERVNALELQYRALDVLGDNLTLEETTSAEDYAIFISRALQNVGYAVPQSFIPIMKRQERFLEFFEGRINTNSTVRDLNAWKVPIGTMGTNLLKIIRTTYYEINPSIKKETAEISQTFKNTIFSSKLNGSNVKQMAKEYDLLSREMGLLSQELQDQTDILRVASAISISFGKFNYHVPNTFQGVMARYENSMKFFEKAFKSENGFRNWKEWKEPLDQLKSKCEKYLQWFLFLENLEKELSSRSFQMRKDSFQIPSGSNMNWIQFIEKYKILSGADGLCQEADVKQKGFELLDKMMRFALERTSITCNGNNVVVKGNFVRFGEIVSRGKLSVCAKGQGITVKIFAAGIFFSDEDLDATGEEVNILVFAPKWEIVGTRSIKLDGANADDMNIVANTATDGLMGLPGGPAGSFYARVGDIRNFQLMRITANGGDGGAGQFGGVGIAGGDGAFNHGRHGDPGKPGGKGGNGGRGGEKGHPGTITIKQGDRGNLIPSITISGKEGKIGIGGVGGRGGNQGWGIRCESERFLWIKIGEDCWELRPFLPRAADGDRGTDGVSVTGILPARRPRDIVPTSREMGVAYKQYFGMNASPDTSDFIKLL